MIHHSGGLSARATRIRASNEWRKLLCPKRRLMSLEKPPNWCRIQLLG